MDLFYSNENSELVVLLLNKRTFSKYKVAVQKKPNNSYFSSLEKQTNYLSTDLFLKS